MLKFVDEIHKDVSQYAPGFELKYNKFYIGLAKNGAASNFIYFRPKKRFIYLLAKGKENPERNEMLDNSDLDWIYGNRSRAYRIKINKIEDYRKNKELIDTLIHDAMEHRNIEP